MEGALAVHRIHHARGAAVGDGDAAGGGAGDHGEVGALAHGLEVGPGTGAAGAVAGGGLVPAEAFLACAVEIVGGRVAGLARGFQEHFRQRVAVARVGHAQRAVAAVEFAAAALVAFAALEVGQHVVPVPALGAQGGPFVVVAGVAADVAHGVDGTRAAQHLAARPPQRAVAQRRLGRGAVIPVHALLAHQLGQPRGHVDEGMPVAGAGFQQQHPVGRILAQAVGQHAAGGAGTHDDVVVHGDFFFR